MPYNYSGGDEMEDKIKELFETFDGEEIKYQIDRAKGFISYYKCAILEIETKFRVLSEQFSVSFSRNPIEAIKTRLKTSESIGNKLLKKGFPLTLRSIEENLFDVAGIRVICTYVDDIYNLADCLLSQDDIKLIRKKDYIKNPKDNGYRSLHLIVEIPIFLVGEKKYVKAEIQLRTVSMESWSNVEHSLCYKKELSSELALEARKKLLEYANACYNIDLDMQALREKIEDDLHNA